MSTPAARTRTERLELVSLNVDMVDALIAGDAAELLHVAGARFPAPFELPPLFDRDALSDMRGAIESKSASHEISFLLLERESGDVVGIAGLSPTGDPDTMAVGYSIYPSFEGRGYATEATLLPGRAGPHRGGGGACARRSRPGHDASIRVARKAGLEPAGTAVDLDAGNVLLFELRL